MRACFDMASTMLGQPKNGDARRKSALSCKLSSSRVRTQIGIRTILNSIPLPFANALSDFLQTWTGTQPAGQTPERVPVQVRRQTDKALANARGIESNARDCAKDAKKSSRRAR